jgi:hypothetical protein
MGDSDEDADNNLGLESEEQGPVLTDEESEFASMDVGGHALAGTPLTSILQPLLTLLFDTQPSPPSPPCPI